MTTYEQQCVTCGHQRHHHPDGEECLIIDYEAGTGGDGVWCPCERFVFGENQE